MKSRRLTSLLVACFALCSLAAPAVTCAAATQQGNCCPDAGKPPCGECPDPARARTTSPGHCLSAPASVTRAIVAPEQSRKIPQPDPQPVDVFSGTLDARSLDASPQPAPQPRHQPRVEAQSPTYLLTRRLRL
ncbi:MAG TPA: hypothetical protein VFS13_01485 [Steroidobacteraceae bacterium]|nr:hypothetical protein [Steroidobacteraceae bacterium]